jgi:hypothetical protein
MLLIVTVTILFLYLIPIRPPSKLSWATLRMQWVLNRKCLASLKPWNPLIGAALENFEINKFHRNTFLMSGML